MKKILLFLFMLLNPSFSWSQNDSLFYHDYSFESQYGAAGAYPAPDYLQMVARFTPVSYPVQLTGVMVWFRNALSPAPFKITVRQDSTGSGSANNSSPLYLGPAIPNPSSSGTPDSAYSSYVDLAAANLVFSSGDVYAGVTQNLALNGFIGLALDTNSVPSFNDRSWISSSQGVAGSWIQFINWSFIPSQLGITAFFDPLPSAITENSKKPFNIFPNPVADNFFIKNIPKEKYAVQVFTMQGKLMKEFTGEMQTEAGYDIRFLPAGLYVVELRTPDSLKHIKIAKL